MIQTSRFYELGGESLTNFKQIYVLNLYRSGLLITNPDKTDIKQRIRDILSQRYFDSDMVSKLDDEGLAALVDNDLQAREKEMGLGKSVVAVRETEGHYPRAYEHYPEIFVTSLAGETKVLMRSPVGYDGQVVEPKDGTLLSEAEQDKTERMLFMPQGGAIPYYYKPSQGAELPHDFVPTSTPDSKAALNHPRVFVLEEGFEKDPAVNGFLKRAFDKANDNVFGNLYFRNFGGRRYVRIDVPDDITVLESSLTEVQDREFQWMLENEYDISLGITPPGLPSELVHLQSHVDQMLEQPRSDSGKETQAVRELILSTDASRSTPTSP